MSMLNKKTIEDLNVNGKWVLVRCDFNVPLKDGVITDENRLNGALPTINYLIENGAKIKTTEMVIFELLKTAKHPNFKEIQALIK